MHSYCSNNAVTVKRSKKFKNSIYNEFLKFEIYPYFICQPASQPASQSAIRPGSASATALEFLHNKGNHVGFTKLFFQRTFIHCAMVLPFILYQLAFVFKLLIGIAKGVNKLVGKVSINLLRHAKSAICVINIIIHLLLLMPWKL